MLPNSTAAEVNKICSGLAATRYVRLVWIKLTVGSYHSVPSLEKHAPLRTLACWENTAVTATLLIPLSISLLHVLLSGKVASESLMSFRRPLTFLPENWDTTVTHARENIQMKKALGETQTLRAGCSKAKPKIFAPPQTLGGAGRPKFNQLEMVTTFTYRPVWRRSMQAISS